MKVAIIILNYNDSENTVKYVGKINNYKILDKILIVDNNSTNKKDISELKLLENDRVEVIQTDKNGGYAYGNNFGLKYLDKKYGEEYFDYVIISNPDIDVTDNAISKSIDFLQSIEDAIIASPRMCLVNGPARRSAWKKRKISIDIANSTRITELLMYPIFKSGEYNKEEFNKDVLCVDAIAGSFFIADFNKFRNIGYFDENTFLFYEEDIIGKRAKEKGYKIYSLNDIKFIHYDSQTIGKLMNLFKKQDILFDSRIYFQKNYNNANRFQILIFKILKYIRKFELIFENIVKKG